MTLLTVSTNPEEGRVTLTMMSPLHIMAHSFETHVELHAFISQLEEAMQEVFSGYGKLVISNEF